MPTSEARLLANRQNALLSTGPKTTEGKDQSRRNSLKHGMAGLGVVLPEPDAAEVALRTEALHRELAPRSKMGVILVVQMATLSVRMERGARQETASVARNVRSAADDFDEARMVAAEELLNSLGENPRTNLRRLRKSPEGVDLMVQTWQDLRADLTREGKAAWNSAKMVEAANLVGIREEAARTSQIGVLSRAIWGDFAGLGESEGGHLDENARKAWAKDRLVAGIDQEIADLEEHYETLDFESIEQDRAGAGDRALFDPSKEASLARRYESEARRGFFQALKQFHLAEAEAEAARELESTHVLTPPPPVSPKPVTPEGPTLASSRGMTPTARQDLDSARVGFVSASVASPQGVARGSEGQVSAIDRPISRTA